jgi:hypothetical protein
LGSFWRGVLGGISIDPDGRTIGVGLFLLRLLFFCLSLFAKLQADE